MGFLFENCTLVSLSKDNWSLFKDFTCGNEDLDDFFRDDAILYQKQLLGKTYFFCLDKDPDKIVCAFTLSNDSVRVDIVPNSRKKKIQEDIPHEKETRRYPGVLIGRLGISNDYKHMHIGTELMDFIKQWFVESANKTGCRFLIVDAYNDPIPLQYYLKNGFKFVFSTEEQENESLNLRLPLKTRSMIFDLIRLTKEDTEQ